MVLKIAHFEICFTGLKVKSIVNNSRNILFQIQRSMCSKSPNKIMEDAFYPPSSPLWTDHSKVTSNSQCHKDKVHKSGAKLVRFIYFVCQSKKAP